MMLSCASASCRIEVAGPDDVADDADVGRVAADHDDRVLGAEEARERLLELAVQRLLARGDAARRDRRAVALDRGVRGAVHRRVAREAEVVVRREVDHLAAVDHRRVVGDALVDVEVRDVDAHGLREVEALAERDVLGELREVVRRRRDVGVAVRAIAGAVAVEQRVFA